MSHMFFKPTVERPLGRPRCGWEDIIRMDLKEICINTRNWIGIIGEPFGFGLHKACSELV